ncbi:YqaJ viral recombinase family nuclease [Paraburkholderia terrae]|uniref:YqaJ viral recombinase family nuclease n=1 Tax=Paraburkholderia terrae TaxID=311230 RepID=UPI00296AE0D1|nr:YqaJ viral recombinase family protein [Paraburkholderia terrae]MDW3655174.1 YqaJ viral recombinase family protein [Paraburkholderia terrae]
MNREQWLAERRHGVGGSDAAASLGLSPYKSTFALWLEKTGEVEPDDIDHVERVHFGRIMEDIIAREYARRMGVKVRRRNEILRHPTYPWMLANVDRIIDGQKRGLECKNVDAMAFRMGEWGEPGTDEVPEDYLLQCQHYMVVLDYPEWHLAACVGGNRLELFIIRRDPELAEMIIDGERDFWQRVERHDAPELDYSRPDTQRLLSKLYPGTDGTEVAFDDDIEHWHRVKVQATALTKQYGDVADAARNHILAAMGNATFGRLADGSGYRRKTITRKAYEVEAATYVDCRHVKAKD